MARPGKNPHIEQLVTEYYQPLFRYAYRLCGSQAEAEDLTQEAFCQAQAKWKQLRDLSRAKSWLFTILRNGFLHRRRSDKTQAQISSEMLADLPEEIPDDEPEFESEELQSILNELPEEFRTPVILFYFEEFSYREIAEQLGIALGTVMSRLARAKAHLRARLMQPVAIASPKSGGNRNGM